MNLFGGKLTGGIFGIIGAIIAVILIGIMAGPFGSLVSYFSDSAEDGDGQRFSRIYIGITGDAVPNRYQINTETNRAGGSGVLLTGQTKGGRVTFTWPASGTGVPTAPGVSTTVYNEQGNPVTIDSSSATTLADTYKWSSPPDAFGKLNFLNRILCTILALVAAIGLIMKVKNSYDAFQKGGSSDLTPTVLREVTTMVLALTGVFFAPTLLNIIGDTATVYTSGQFDFGFVDNILEIVFAIIPTMLLIALMGLVSSEQIQDRAISVGSAAVGRANPMRYRRRRAMAM